MEEFMNTTRDKLEVIKHETKELAGSLKKISDALAGIDSRSATICGATLENILDLIYEYEIRNGKHPMSSKSIKAAFESDRIKIGNVKPLKDTCNEIAGLAFNLHTKLYCEEKKAPAAHTDMSEEVFAAKVQVKLYDILASGGVTTRYQGKISQIGDAVWMVPSRGCPFKLVAENRFLFSTYKGLTVKNAAAGIALKILKKHSCEWEAFAAHISIWSEGYFDVIYGVLEAKANKIPIFYGSVGLDGSWFHNDKLALSPGEQYNHNVKNGHLCGKCMKSVSVCQCGGKS